MGPGLNPGPTGGLSEGQGQMPGPLSLCAVERRVFRAGVGLVWAGLELGCGRRPQGRGGWLGS